MSAAIILVAFYALGAIGWYDLVRAVSGDKRMAFLVALAWPLSLAAGGIFVLWSNYEDRRALRANRRAASAAQHGSRE